MKYQEASRLLSSLGLKICLSKVSALDVIFSKKYKINEMVNKFLLTGDKFTAEMQLRKSGLSYSAGGPFTKKKEKIQIFKEIEDPRYIPQNQPEKVFSMHEMVYREFKDLARRITFDKLLRDK